MTVALLLLPQPLCAAVAAELDARGVRVRVAVEGVPPEALSQAGADLLVLHPSHGILTPDLVAAADRAGVRIVPVGGDDGGARLAAAFGLPAPLSPASPLRKLVDAILVAVPVIAPVDPVRPAVVAVWGAHGAPGRTTLAIELAVEAARGGGHVALVDADVHAPAIALSLGLPDEGPGLPAACRQAGLSRLDTAELTRIAVPLEMPGRDVDVLTGINRPSRWPELSASRMSAVLHACRSWAAVTVVDVAASLERDEEIVSDLEDGPRRNAATLATLTGSDRVVAVLAADPVGIARFLRGYAELREVIGATPVTVVVNRLRTGPIGLDTRGQIRRALERYAGLRDLWFVPDDRRGADAARLAARPAAHVAPRSALSAAVARLAASNPRPSPEPVRGLEHPVERRAQTRAEGRRRRSNGRTAVP